MTLPVPSTFIVSTNTYPGIEPAGLSPSANSLTGLPLTSTHTVTGFLVDGLSGVGVSFSTSFLPFSLAFSTSSLEGALSMAFLASSFTSLYT